MVLPFCWIFVPVIVNSQSNFRVKVGESVKFGMESEFPLRKQDFFL
jgi:hypothetical protein